MVVIQTPTRFWPHALAYLCAQALDAATTLAVIASGGHELNPVLEAARMTRGIAGLLALKVLFAALVWCAARVAYLAPSTRGTRLAAVIFWLGALAGLLLAAANVSVLTLYLAAPR